MTILVAIVRLVLAGVFVVSAVAKLRDRTGSRGAVQAFGVPLPLVGIVTAGLPVAELACAALLLLPDPAATAGAIGSLVLLLAFTTAIVVNLLRGRRPECHCFGSVGDKGGIGWDTVARNAVLILLAALALVGAGSLRSVPSTLADLSLAEAGLLLAALFLLAVLVAMGLALQTLIRRYGAVLLRLEAVEQATGLAAPKLAPEFRLPDLDGNTMSLDDVLASGKPALIAFVSPSCHNCAELLPDLSAWQSDPDHALAVVVISDGSIAENRAKIADSGPLRVLLQDRLETANAYEIQGTPGAVLLGVDGRLAGAPVHAVAAVRRLHDATIRNMTGGEPVPTQGSPHVHTLEPRPVSIGDHAPEVVLRSDDGDSDLNLTDALGDDAVLLFWRTDCGYCQRIVDDVRALETSVPVRIITGSDLAAVRASGLTSPVLREPSGDLGAWLRVPGTPSAARIRDGVLESAVVVGGPDVLDLLRVNAGSDAPAG